MKTQQIQTVALQRAQKSGDRPDSEASKFAPANAHRDRVDVELKQELSELTSAAMTQPIDDLSLQELKDAIRSGSYEPDLTGLRDRLLAQPAVIDELLS